MKERYYTRSQAEQTIERALRYEQEGDHLKSEIVETLRELEVSETSIQRATNNQNKSLDEVVQPSAKISDLRDSRIPIVNGLLKKTFGSKVVGNLKDSDTTPLPETNRLYFIANRRILGLHKVIGQFDCDDGSSIRVLPKYSQKAEIYAKMYEAKFGKKANITLDPDADAGPSY